MRKLLFLATALLPLSALAQQVATFEALPLSGTDTFYISKSSSLQDNGFNDGAIHFPYVWDTAFGGGWSTGFAYSNKKDSVTSGYLNQYSAKPASGYNGSDKYVVYWAGYGTPVNITLTSKALFAPQGFYYTNSTYAYNSMHDGDFVAKKFGGVTGNDTDWFKVTVRAYRGGVLKPDSVSFYLADFRFANNAQDYIVKDWRYVNLTSFGAVDSLFFELASSDTGAFGINTPTYFCIDNFAIGVPLTGVAASAAVVAKVYPNPATDHLIISLNDAGISQASVYDMSGKLIARQTVARREIIFNTAGFSSGIYLLKLEGNSGTSSMRFVKQ